MKKKTKIAVIGLAALTIPVSLIFLTNQKPAEKKPTVDKNISLFLANYEIQDSRAHGDFAVALKQEMPENSIFRTLEKDKDVYFFAGANPTNWVYFAGFYWRIIRTNENGSVRLIYNGPTTEETGPTTQIGTGAYNSADEYFTSSNDKMYVGFTFELDGQQKSSLIKEKLDTWFADNLIDYIEYLDTTQGFCADAQVSEHKEYTTFAPWDRLDIDSHKVTLDCLNTYYYTTEDSQVGNHYLKYPIGLLTADEAVFAGAFHGSPNDSYWLHTREWYWTMSPARFDTNAYVFYILNDGSIRSNFTVASKFGGIRPVINVKNNILKKGFGTKEKPYTLDN